jgi:hypothetical protein
MIEDLRHWETLASMCDRAMWDLDYMELAAHVYAHMMDILLNGWVPVRPARVPPGLDLAEIRAAIVGLVDLTDRGEIYWSLQLVLDAIDRNHSEVDSADWSTTIGLRTLKGKVYIWGRRASPLAKLRSTLLEQIPDRSRSPNLEEPEPNLNLANLRLFWTDSECELSRVRGGAHPYRLLQPATENDEALRIALCPLEGGFHPCFELVPGGFHSLRKKPMKDPEGLIQRLSEVLGAAGEQRVHLVVFPELMVSEDALTHLRSVLLASESIYPYGVIAGSFHIWKGQNRIPVNESCLLEKTGILLVHQKRGRFKLPKQDIGSEFFPQNSLEDQPHHIVESIEYGQKLRFVDTIFGTIAIMICADLVDNSTRSFLEAARALRPDLLIVVSMSPKTRHFEVEIQRLYSYGIATFMVNASCICKTSTKQKLAGKEKPDSASLVLAHLGLFEHSSPDTPHSYFRWRADDGSVEFWSYRHGSNGWETLDAPQVHGVSHLQVNGIDVGVIFDYAPQMSFANRSK